MGLKEILCLYHYSLELKEKVKNITADGKIKDKTATSMIYKDMLQYLPNVTLNNLQIQIHRTKIFLCYYENDQQVYKTVTIDNNQNHMTLAKTILSVTSQTKFSSENFDYYRIINDTSCGLKRTCSLLCSLDHDDEESIEGRYKAGSYFIKCKQHEIEIVA
ncbi:hypothetical protein RhiirC2_776128 [Rhizophagus irregularis]|uniref:Uncharacterized protein n=1 Tax=Rhizophagus irregularis TaxID=588596 RepID=A0A2N1NHH2_9GLOM|nr:hypothetical protein RhiirC2_776128 [Rhizophagus irregularis]